MESIFGGFRSFLVGLLGQTWGGALAEVLKDLAVAIGLVLFIVITFMYLTYLERKVIARLQDRIGPNRVGPLGLLQPFADAVKMLTKEDITPLVAERWVYNLAAIVVIPSAFMAFAVLPFGRGLVPADLNIGILYIFALGSTSAIAIFMAGWSSANKYALLGAMRAVAQLVSYEIPQVLSVVGVLVLAGSLQMSQIVLAQKDIPFILLQPVGFALFLIASLAEVARTPFDLPEAESELTAGYHVEYSGLKFGMFQMAEFVAAFVVAAVAASLFLGGWLGPVLPDWLWFLLKTYAMVFVMQWLRGTLPRLRIDQLMNFAWKFLVPVAIINLIVSATVAVLTASLTGWALFIPFLIANAVVVLAALFIASASVRSPAPTPVAVATSAAEIAP